MTLFTNNSRAILVLFCCLMDRGYYFPVWSDSKVSSKDDDGHRASVATEVQKTKDVKFSAKYMSVCKVCV